MSGGVDDTLCCCEYHNQKGERSHILACCCDCEAVDEACDRCLTCRGVNNRVMQRVFDTVGDRCRIPGCWGQGAVRVRLELVVPMLLVPAALCLATLGAVATVIVLLLLPLIMLAVYRAWLRHRSHGERRTAFFFIWGLTSVFFTLMVFIVFVIAYREILLWELLLFFSAVVLMFYCLFRARKNPGILPHEGPKHYPGLPNGRTRRESFKEQRTVLMEEGEEADSAPSSLHVEMPTLPASSVTWVDSRPIEADKLVTWCQTCNFPRPPRSGHCSVCEACIRVRDHHCVWIDNCIGAANHRAFLLAMLLFIFCGLYGSHLTMTTICTPQMYFDWLLLPSDCRFLYGDFQTALCFVCTCYTLLATCGMLVGLAHQFLLISQNLTSQELHRATARRQTRFVFFAKNNLHNQGFFRNWLEFWLQHSRKVLETKHDTSLTKCSTRPIHVRHLVSENPGCWTVWHCSSTVAQPGAAPSSSSSARAASSSSSSARAASSSSSSARACSSSSARACLCYKSSTKGCLKLQ